MIDAGDNQNKNYSNRVSIANTYKCFAHILNFLPILLLKHVCYFPLIIDTYDAL